jgi:hypothetical protein
MLEASIRRLHGFLMSRFPFPWSIVILDLASSDRTFAIGLRLSYELSGVELTRMRHPDRKQAIRCVSQQSHARVLCSLDVNLKPEPWAWDADGFEAESLTLALERAGEPLTLVSSGRRWPAR